MILPCSCIHTAQDQTHGRGQRVFNLCGVNGHKARCTVCKREVTLAAKKADEKKEVKK